MKKYFFRIIVLLLFISIFGFVNLNFAFAKSVEDEIAELKARITVLEAKLTSQERKTASQEKSITQLKEEGIPLFEGLNIGAGATFVVQGTVDANATQKKGEDATDGTYSCDLEIEKEFDEYGLAFMHLEAGGGAGLDGDELSLFSGVNRDAGDTSSNAQVTELWYEHYLLDNLLTLTFGKLDATCYLDNNAVANDETTQFLGHAFRNSTALEFPDDNGPGLRAAINPVEWLEINTGILDDDANWEDIADDNFIFGQFNIMPNFLGREGNYRFYAWHDNSYHTKLTDTSKTKEDNYGAGISFDQELTGILTCFTRFGWEDPDVSNIEYAWSVGAQIAGQPWGREDDVFALAVGQDIPSDDYGKAGNADDNEGHFEAYYNFKVNEHLSISPDIQVIWNPNGVGTGARDDTVTVIGLRSQVDF